MVTKHFQELHQKELRAEREDVQKMRRIAGSVAKLVREFWSNIEKVSFASVVLCIMMISAILEVEILSVSTHFPFNYVNPAVN